MPRRFATVEVGPPAQKGEGRIRRSYMSPDILLTTPGNDASLTTLASILARSASLYGDQKALGWRETIRTIKETKQLVRIVDGKEVTFDREWTYYELSDYKWWTYSEFAEHVADAASALVQTGHSKSTIFNIYSSTSPRWQLMCQACARQGITFATAYDNLGDDGLRHSINDPSAYGIFTNANLLGKIASVIGETPSLRVVIFDGASSDVKEGALETIRAANGGIRVFSLDELLELGKSTSIAPDFPTPESLACIMFTSGSTAVPKGVMLTNGNLVAAISGVGISLREVIHPADEQYFLAYLPLAHCLEFIVEIGIIYLGVKMGYGSVKTLTDVSVRNCLGDIRTFRPTVLVGVPAVWELIRKGIDAKVKAGGKLKSAVFNTALSLKKYFGMGSSVALLLDSIVFKAVKEATGGRLRFGISGGAAISKDTQEYLSNVLAPILQGYGMTESCALTISETFVLLPEFFSCGSVGMPLPSGEIKLVDYPEAGYYSTNSPPQGEVWIRGAAVTPGYYKMPELTAETITKDGWLQTGDIGQWNEEDGTLSVIDRKKILIKLSGGEYVALERLESVYSSCRFVARICVHADSNATKPMAVVVPNVQSIEQLVSERSIPVGEHADVADLCAIDAVEDAVLAELNAVAKKAGLKSLEMLQCIILTPYEWTTENGLLTAAQKLQRKPIIYKYRAQIDSLYP